ncbi:hypothetical protein GCM10010123_40590 [Pilimelia anulata]|uniref:Polyprenyl synthetase n=1 Tax=Pilimelia anulata TaxID=53371 RepID=A0A8J3FE21_9ACTN|nr:polyprenyl synthetase family protein [Pilimelia anulata]GGK06691.1 hypothetical protein GCM10010123_40590 [Pilimelia anulata]
MPTFADFKAEMADSHARVVARCLAELAELGMSAAGLAYVRELRGYPRTPYYATLWVRDPRARRAIGEGLGVHAVGVKLLDDLIDGDTPLGPRDQIFGAHLIMLGAALLAGRERPADVLAALVADYRDIWRQEVVEVTAPHPATLDAWLAAARIKAGVMIANYAALACLAGGAPDGVPRARSFGEALGVLYMIGDDVTDFDDGERAGNLVHLVATGRVDRAALAAAIGGWRDRAAAAAAGTVCDPVPFLDHFAAKLRDLVADRTTAPPAAAAALR